MNNAIYALPGFMPPAAPNFRQQLIAPEDGSLRMLVHCGYEGDVVNYAIVIRGMHPGTIKDPGYAYSCGSDDHPWQGTGSCCLWASLRRNFWPQFLTVSDSLPQGLLIPNRIVCGCPIPLTERHDCCGKEKYYWYIELPPRSLPMGDTVVQVVVNGKLHKYIVQRPAFAIHNRWGITHEYCRYNNQKGENLDIAISVGRPGKIRLNISNTTCGESQLIKQEAEFRAAMLLDGEETSLECVLNGDWLTITIPAQTKPSTGLWKAQMKLFEDWIPLSCGDLHVVIPEDACGQTLTDVYIPLGSSGTIDIPLDKVYCGGVDMLIQDASFRAYLEKNGEQEALEYELNGSIMTIKFPVQEIVENSVWKAEFDLFGEWLPLTSGKIIVVEN